jgi:hypothetical protein
MRRIHGSCHCGNIRFDLDWPDPGAAIPVRVCGCSFCRKHGGVWTSNPRGRFRLQIADGARVNPYRFGTESADFHVCASCGAVPIVTCVMDGARYAVVNANAFDIVDRAELAQAAADFEGESRDSRLARRRRNWTPEAAG